MKRKNVTEYAFGYMNSFTSMMTAHALMSDGHLTEGQDELDKCHIYAIATRPNTYFISDSLMHDGLFLSGEIGYRIEGQEYRTAFSKYPFQLFDGGIEIRCEYPFHELWTYNAAGDRVRYLPATHLASLLENDSSNGHLKNFEVLYIGQAIGQGNRSAQQRLKKHETLQKILAQSAYKSPDKEIVVFMYQFENEYVFSSMDGRAHEAVSDNTNEHRLVSAMKTPPNKKQKISMIEAGLIRYFQPHYNAVYKVKFPSTKHKTLQSCKALDVSALVVELDSSDLGFTLSSPTIKASNHHIARFDLVNVENRMSFFNATGMTEVPGVIKSV